MSGFPESRQLQKTAPAASHPTGTKKEPEKLTQKRVKELLDYDPETGLLTWKVNRRGSAKAGDVIKTVDGAGYIQLSVDSKRYLAHRVIWLWNYGYFPENQVDHINRIKTDNRLCNLREVSRSCNLQNTNLSMRNSTGVKGVSPDKSGLFRVFIMFKGYQSCVVSCKDFVEAVAHRLAAEQCFGLNGCDSQSSAYLYMQNYVKEKKGSEFTETPS